MKVSLPWVDYAMLYPSFVEENERNEGKRGEAPTP